MAKKREGLPGEELISKGLEDLRKGISSLESLLVLIGAPRLKRVGIDIPTPANFPSSPEHALYQLLQRDDPQDAYGRYNSLIRRLVSFERTLESLPR
jgi:hypothetical protein